MFDAWQEINFRTGTCCDSKVIWQPLDNIQLITVSAFTLYFFFSTVNHGLKGENPYASCSEKQPCKTNVKTIHTGMKNVWTLRNAEFQIMDSGQYNYWNISSKLASQLKIRFSGWKVSFLCTNVKLYFFNASRPLYTKCCSNAMR